MKRSSKAFLLWIAPATLCVGLFIPAPLRAATYTWNVSSGKWNVSSNWSPPGQPWASTGDIANVNSGTIIPVNTNDFLGRLNLNSGATFLMDTSGEGTGGSTGSTANNLHLNGGTIKPAGGLRTLYGAITLDSESYFDMPDGLTLYATLSGNATLVKTNGASAVTLGADSTATFTGNMEVYAGTLNASANGAYGTGGAITVHANGTMTQGGSGSNVTVLVKSGGQFDISSASGSRWFEDLRMQGGSVYCTHTSSRALYGKLKLETDTEAYFSAHSFFHPTIHSVISGPGKLIKIGAYIISLTGSNWAWNAGIDINEGVLLVSESVNDDNIADEMGAGPVSIASNATLQVTLAPANTTATIKTNHLSGLGTIFMRAAQGTYSLHKVVFDGATLSPGGAGDTGALTLDSRDATLGTVANPATLEIELGGTDPGESDMLKLTTSSYPTLGTDLPGVLDVTQCALVVDSVRGFTTPGEDFTIVSNAQASGRTVSGPFLSITMASGWNGSVDYAGGDGNDIVLTAVYFPAGTLLILR